MLPGVRDVTKATKQTVPTIEETNSKELYNHRAADGADDNPYSKDD